MARLQSEFCAKDVFWATNFLTKNAPKLSPKFVSLYSVGQKKSPKKFPPKFPTKFPCEKSEKLHRRASAGAQGEKFVSECNHFCADSNSSMALSPAQACCFEPVVAVRMGARERKREREREREREKKKKERERGRESVCVCVKLPSKWGYHWHGNQSEAKQYDFLGERLRGNTIRGNRPERFWEGNLPLRGSLRGSLRGRVSEVFRVF